LSKPEFTGLDGNVADNGAAIFRNGFDAVVFNIRCETIQASKVELSRIQQILELLPVHIYIYILFSVYKCNILSGTCSVPLFDSDV